MRSLVKEYSPFFLPFFFLLALFLMLETRMSDSELTLRINLFHHEVFDSVFVFFTWIGSGNVWVCLILGLILLRFTGKYQKTLFFLIWVNLAGLIVQVIKRGLYWSMARPAAVFSEHCPALHLLKDFPIYRLHTFPSGHTATAFSIAVLLTAFSSNKRCGYLYLILAVFIGWSRIYLGQHFLLDVVVGSVLGSFIALVGIYLAEKMQWFDKPWFKAMGPTSTLQAPRL